MQHKKLTLRITGFIASLLLTVSAYFIILNPGSFYLGSDMAVLTIFILALLQSIAQLICFIDLWNETGAYWNFGVFVSTISIIFVVVFFSIWIMHHLNYNMMPQLQP